MLPEIEKSLQAKGVSVPRPKYDASGSTAVDNDEKEESEDKTAAASEDEEVAKSVKANRLDKFKHKANHEATSDEDN